MKLVKEQKGIVFWKFFFLLSTLGIMGGIQGRGDPGPPGLARFSPSPFPVVPETALKTNFDFWVKIYTQYSSFQGVIHDAKYIDRVYEVIDFGRSKHKDFSIIRRAKKKWKAALLSVHRKQNIPAEFTEDERKVFELYRGIDEPHKFLNAAHRKRLRFQLGQSERFLEGLHESGRYLPAMEEVFRQRGLPVELTRLPFVESSFNTQARSKVGASGVWQFMRSTARLFIQVNESVDERNDPIRAAEAAAQLLQVNYESLGSWPLAVTAYNHGRKGMMRAVRRVGSDHLEDLIVDSHSRSFGFASSNFFAELLASIEVSRNPEKYFHQEISRAKPFEFVEVHIDHSLHIHQLIQRLKIDKKTLKEFNPALTDAVFAGRQKIPEGYLLRLPESQKQKAQQLLKYDTRSEK